MKVLISGASGFIGHHLITACLEKGWEVVGVDKRPLPSTHYRPNHFIQTNVKDLGYRDLMDIDYIFHLAFVTNIPNSVRHPVRTTYDNVGSIIHVLQFAREAGVKKVIYPSTASLYGNNPTPWTEDMPPHHIEPYSFQKLCSEEACKLYAREYGLKTTIVRLFQVFGEYQRSDTALAAFLKQKRDGKPITLTETTAQSTFKSGQRDFIYAGDVAQAMIKVAESEKTGMGEIFNVCSGNVRTMEDIADTIDAKVKWIPKRNYEVERHEGSIKKIQSLGWKPKVDVIKWLQSQRT